MSLTKSQQAILDMVNRIGRVVLNGRYEKPLKRLKSLGLINLTYEIDIGLYKNSDMWIATKVEA